jgi:hypothetical protein
VYVDAAERCSQNAYWTFLERRDNVGEPITLCGTCEVLCHAVEFIPRRRPIERVRVKAVIVIGVRMKNHSVSQLDFQVGWELSRKPIR